MLFRILLIGLAAGAVLVAQKQYDLIHRTGLFSGCRVIATPIGDSARWKQCRQGLLGSRPSLSGQGCVAQPADGRLQDWRCPLVAAAGGS
jgi:hypothetical protein